MGRGPQYWSGDFVTARATPHVVLQLQTPNNRRVVEEIKADTSDAAVYRLPGMADLQSFTSSRSSM